MRNVLLTALLVFSAACNAANGSKLDPQPTNLVCDRVALLNKDAECTPELTDVGELHTHRARVKVTSKEGTSLSACVLNDRTIAMQCDGLLPAEKPQAQPQQPAPAAEPAKAKR
jgi:hypothetical protein